MSSSPRRGHTGDSQISQAPAGQGSDRIKLVSSAKTLLAGAPPAFPFRRFRAAIAGLQLAGDLPSSVNGPVWSSGRLDALDDELLHAFRFLGLLDDARRPTPHLTDLVTAFGSPAWAQNLQRMLRDSYHGILSASLEQASPSHLLRVFRKRFGLDPMRARAAAGFFVHAAREAQLELGQLVPTSSQPASSSPSTRAARERMTKMLLSRLPRFNDEWSDELKLAWLAAFRDILSSP